MADLFDVIADPTRRELLRALLESGAEPIGTGAAGVGEASVGELVHRLSLSQPTVSKHLKTLRDFGVVSVREQGQHRYYRLEPARLEPVAEWLGAFLKPVVAEQIVEPETVAVVDSAPAHPLPPPLRTIAIRVGAVAAIVAARVGARGH